MVEYTCKKCNKCFKLKGDYKRHIDKIYPCKNTQSINNVIIESKNDSIESQNDSKQCKYCGNSLSSNSNYHRHIRSCKMKKIQEKEETHEIQYIL